MAINFMVMTVSMLALAGVPALASQACDQVQKAYLQCAQGAAAPFEVRANGDFALNLDGQTKIVPCSDGLNLGFYQRAQNMDIASILSIPYPVGEITLPGTTDPGRLREQDLFKAVYGTTAGKVERNLRRVSFLGSTIRFNKKNGAANAIEAIGKEIDQLADTDPEFARALSAWGDFRGVSRGKFNWRVVAGTTNLSVHSFGTAIDLKPVETGLPEYWRWHPSIGNRKEEDVLNFPLPNRISSFPAKLVDIFERHGFIWGGKWHHFDSMHFEYRPEFYPDFRAKCE